jgi:hypothetical protein
MLVQYSCMPSTINCFSKHGLQQVCPHVKMASWRTCAHSVGDYMTLSVTQFVYTVVLVSVDLSAPL